MREIFLRSGRKVEDYWELDVDARHEGYNLVFKWTYVFDTRNNFQEGQGKLLLHDIKNSYSVSIKHYAREFFERWELDLRLFEELLKNKHRLLRRPRIFNPPIQI